MKLFCDIINQRFAQSFRLAAAPHVIATQNDDWPLEVYLVVPNREGGRFPFMYDDSSGKDGLSASVALSNPGGTPLTLVTPTVFEAIPNGFAGMLRLKTWEIQTFLTGHNERICALSVEVTDADNNRVTSFVGYIILRAASTAAGAVAIPGVIRRKDITAYTGGTATDLEGLATVGQTIGTQWQVTIDGSESHWEYAGPGTTPSDVDAGVILTTDGGNLRRTIGY